ncbi:MAG: biotin/lipoyl-binding protein, partial [Chloroflexota bacterium]|nr:biotin/lipoyl-binding protein [Chloroflexota bacterium]
MWNTLRAIKLWQVGVLVVVLVGAAAAVYFGFNMTRSSEGTGLTKDQQAVPAQVGNLVNQVSVSGALTYPNTEVLTFDSAGTVSKVLVTEGQKVKVGQSLAQLDNSSVASLQKAVAQAQVNLDTAQTELDAAKAPYSATDIAQAEANVAAKKLAVQSAQKALDTAKTPFTAIDIAQAEANVAAKKLAVQSAQKALDTAKAPFTAIDIAQAEANVSAKKLALQTAQQSLDNLLKPTDQALAQARSAVSSAQLAAQKAKQELDALKATSPTADMDTARSTLDTAKVNLNNSKADKAASKSDWDTKVATAQDAYNTATTNYKNVFSKYLGVNLTDVQAAQEPDALLTSLQIDLATLYDRQSGPLAIGPGGQISIPADSPATTWDEFVVFAWTYLRPGTVFGTCQGFTLPANSVCVRSEIDTAWTPVQTTANTLASTKVQADKAAAAAQKAVEQAQDALTSAQKAFDLLVAGADPV